MGERAKSANPVKSADPKALTTCQSLVERHPRLIPQAWTTCQKLVEKFPRLIPQLWKLLSPRSRGLLETWGSLPSMRGQLDTWESLPSITRMLVTGLPSNANAIIKRQFFSVAPGAPARCWFFLGRGC